MLGNSDRGRKRWNGGGTTPIAESGPKLQSILKREKKKLKRSKKLNRSVKIALLKLIA